MKTNNPQKRYSKPILGIDIGGTKMTLLLGNEKGTIYHRISRPSHAKRGPTKMIQEMIDMGFEILRISQLDSNDILGIGISCGGPLDAKKGIVYSPPNLPGWDHIPLKRKMEKSFGITTYLENDANATALAELYWGGGQGKSNIIYLTMGTGIGGGLILDGKLYHGTNDMAGEFGHTIVLPKGPKCNCGKKGCLEIIASGTGIAHQAKSLAKDYPDSLVWKMVKGRIGNLTSEIVCDAARREDPLATAVIKQTTYYMGLGLSNLIQIINPEIIIIGTLMYKAEDLLLKPIRDMVKKYTWPRMKKVCQIIPSPLQEKGQDLATLAIVKYQQKNSGMILK